MQAKDFKYLKPLHLELLKILHDFSKIAKEANVEYYLAYGSLLGAARHKGIIPWDDDIDISMTRHNYDKLIDYFKKNKNSNFKLSCFETDGSLAMYAKFIKKGSINNIKEYQTHPDGLCIDIFPLDNAYSSKNIFQKINENKVRNLKRIVSSREKIKNNQKEPKYKRIIRRIIVLPFIPFDNKKLIRRAIKLAKKYNNRDTCDLIFYGTTYSFKKDHHSKEIWEKTVLLQFGEEKYPVPVGYKKFLRKCYGNDYYKMPSSDVLHIHDNTQYIGWSSNNQ